VIDGRTRVKLVIVVGSEQLDLLIDVEQYDFYLTCHETKSLSCLCNKRILTWSQLENYCLHASTYVLALKNGLMLKDAV